MSNSKGWVAYRVIPDQMRCINDIKYISCTRRYVMEIKNKKVVVKINNNYLVEFGREYYQTTNLFRFAKVFNSIEDAVGYCKKLSFYAISIERRTLCDTIIVSHRKDIIKRARCRALLGLSLTKTERNLFLIFGDKKDVDLYLKFEKENHHD